MWYLSSTACFRPHSWALLWGCWSALRQLWEKSKWFAKGRRTLKCQRTHRLYLDAHKSPEVSIYTRRTFISHISVCIRFTCPKSEAKHNAIKQRECQVSCYFCVLLRFTFQYGKVTKQTKVRERQENGKWESNILQITVVPEVIWTPRVNWKQTELWLMNVLLWRLYRITSLRCKYAMYSRYRLVRYRIRREIGYNAMLSVRISVCVSVETHLEREIAYSADFLQSQVPRTKRYPVY